ncbi:hypothetical protein IAI58_07850 [Roseomonas marmotae]|uniref:Lipoprotein n=2 Tax=Roseomonas marmotae TaxID=2768161 RepID=A0ABS3KDY5_9PROT|nr:hypothetical protein [Roseomonas marmotae]MBO1074868.1 hypothetical protein [Roseomonas marmotae]QTI80883.1 hypothetical protein IAI58_07850 [Roseomonas marmotae]
MLALLVLGGCQSLRREGTADLAGIAGASLSEAITDNGAVTAGIGIGVRSLARAGLQYTERRAQRIEQDSIANAAGSLKLGQVGTWSVRHDVPMLPNREGRVTVVRDIGGIGLQCREILFSVEGDEQEIDGELRPHKAFYTAAICRNGETWKWANAEPATERWGALQ